MPGFRFVGVVEASEGFGGESGEKVLGKLSVLERRREKWSRNLKCFCEINVESSEGKQQETRC